MSAVTDADGASAVHAVPPSGSDAPFAMDDSGRAADTPAPTACRRRGACTRRDPAGWRRHPRPGCSGFAHWSARALPGPREAHIGPHERFPGSLPHRMRAVGDTLAQT